MSSPPNKNDKEIKLEDNMKSLEELIRRMSSKVENASILNGGYDELREEIKEIKSSQFKVMSDLGNVHKELPEIKSEIKEIKKSIYDPDNGLYTRIRESNADSLRRETMLQKVSDKATTIESKIDSLELKFAPIEKTTAQLKEIAGSNLEELSSITKTKNNINKIWWAVVLAFAAGLGKIILDQIIPLF